MTTTDSDMNSDMNGDTNSGVERYLGALEDHLRQRGVTRDRIADHLEEVAGHLRDTGADPHDEYGPPDGLAHRLAAAGGVGARWIVALVRMLVLGALTMGGLLLLSRGSGSATLDGSDLALIGAAALAVAVTTAVPATARLRDSLNAVDSNRGASFSRAMLAQTAAATIGFLAVLIGLELVLDGQSLSFGSARAWVVGTLVLAASVPGWLWALWSARGPRFPTGSGMRSTAWDRRVRLRPSAPTATDQAATIGVTLLAVAVGGGLWVVSTFAAGFLGAFFTFSFGQLVARYLTART